jgi:hypothetical protein
MEQLNRQAPPDRSLAVWAGACLGGTALAAIAVFLLLAAAQSPLKEVTEHPLATVLTTAAVIACFTSLAALSRLGKAATHLRRRQLWYRSLTCNLILVGIVVGVFGVNAGLDGINFGLILCVMELIAIVLHVVALSLPSVRA